MRSAVVLPVMITVGLGAACGDAPAQKASLSVNGSTLEPGWRDLLQKGHEQLVALGRDPACFDAQIVDRLTTAIEPKETERPAHKLAVVFMPRGCAEEYCLEFAGMASREMLWCVDRVPPTRSQARAIEIAYRRYRDEYPSAPELEALVVFAHESANSVLFEFDDRKYWDDVKAGRAEPTPGDPPMYELSKKELGLQVARTINAPAVTQE